MFRWLCAMLVCLATLPLWCDAPRPQMATVTAVTLHKSSDQQEAGVPAQYDVSLKVGASTYVVLYTPPSGANGVEYAVGQDLLVNIGSKTISFTKLGRTSEVPILRQEVVSEKGELDLSLAPSQYFSQKLQHLSDRLNLTSDQQAKIKPILEQEAGEAGQFMGNSVLTKEDKLKRLEIIVRSSDRKLKPMLSADQWQTLQSLRKQQKQEVQLLLEQKR